MWNPMNSIDESGTALLELNIILPTLAVPVLLLRDECFEKLSTSILRKGPSEFCPKK